jgi:phosphate transport system protein
MSHYEERLEHDLQTMKQRLRDAGASVERALHDAVRALLAEDHDLAYRTILGDLRINRSIRDIDALCHAFVARHLPSAGHLRFVSSVLRLNVALERVGDYAVSICRQSVQLSCGAVGAVRRDIELLAEQSRRALSQGLRAWSEENAELARGTKVMASQIGSTFRKVFADLLAEGERDVYALRDLFAFLVILNRLERVSDQAKNVCEETVFRVTGETKAPKVYRILFLDERNSCKGPLAASLAAKAFPGSGRYVSAGWEPSPEVDATTRGFAQRHSLQLSKNGPSSLVSLRDELEDFAVIVGLDAGAKAQLGEVPYHTIFLSWDVGEGPDGNDPQEDLRRVAGVGRRLAHELRELMEALHGEGAG